MTRPQRTSGRCRSAAAGVATRFRSIGRPSAGNIEHRAGRERAVGRGAEGGERRDLLDGHEAAARDFRQHEVDVLLRHLVEDCGLGRRRGDAVDRDVVRSELLAERLGEGDDAGLGRGIGRRVRVALLAGDRRDVDDAAVILRDHQRRQRPAAVKRAVEIDRQHVAPGLQRIFPGRHVRPGDAGIVDQNVDAAERLAGVVARALDLGVVGHVDRKSRNLTSERTAGLVRKRLVAVPDRDRRAGGEKALDDGAADALGAAGDHRVLARQIDRIRHETLRAGVERAGRDGILGSPGKMQPPREMAAIHPRACIQALVTSDWGRPMHGWILGLFLCTTFFGGIVTGLAGFAMGLVVSGVWLHILTPAQTASLIVGYGLLTQSYNIWKLRHALNWRTVAPFVIGGLIGVPIGAALVTYVDPNYVRTGVGVLLILYSVYSLARPHLKPRNAGFAADAGIGVINGVLG